MNRKKTSLGTGNRKLTKAELGEGIVPVDLEAYEALRAEYISDADERECERMDAEARRISNLLDMDALWGGKKDVKLFINDAGTVACADCVKEAAWLKEARDLTLKDCEESVDVDGDDQPYMGIKPECCMCGDRCMFSLLPEK